MKHLIFLLPLLISYHFSHWHTRLTVKCQPAAKIRVRGGFSCCEWLAASRGGWLRKARQLVWIECIGMHCSGSSSMPATEFRSQKSPPVPFSLPAIPYPPPPSSLWCWVDKSLLLAVLYSRCRWHWQSHFSTCTNTHCQLGCWTHKPHCDSTQVFRPLFPHLNYRLFFERRRRKKSHESTHTVYTHATAPKSLGFCFFLVNFPKHS